MKCHWNIFWSPGFILGLILLLVNDHYLKSAFHNSFTGKLSDVAGLFIFPMFFAAIFPSGKKQVYLLTIIGFIFWKSSLSDAFIQIWNSMGVFSIQRVVDYTDLITLLIVPISYLYFKKNKATYSRLTPIPVIVIASFAFIATSQPSQKLEVNKIYQFSYPLDTLKHRIFFHPNLVNTLRDEWLWRDSMQTVNFAYLHKDSLKKKDELMKKYLELENHNTKDTNTCTHGTWATMKISGNSQRSEMHITQIWHYCNEKKEMTPRLLQIFEALVLPDLMK